jgi:phosphatidylglycerol---prolipoprotein diacylglyceryl transferase
VFPILRLGPAAVQTSSLLLVLGIYLSMTLSERFARRGGKNFDTLTNLVLLTGLSGLVTARLVYAVGHASFFHENLAGLISPDPSLLDPWGGLVGGGMAALIYSRRKKIQFWAALDGLTPFFALMAVFIGLAHLASGQAFGSPAALPWAIELWGASRHPSQIYETLGAIAILLLFWMQYGSTTENGSLFLKFAILTSGMLVFLSAFRGDSRLILGSLRQEQVLALAVLGVALFILEIKSTPRKQEENR